MFRILADWGGFDLGEVESTWNLGIGMFAVVRADAASSVVRSLGAAGHVAWVAGRVSTASRDLAGFEQGAKGVAGGAVRLVGAYAG